MLKPFYKNGRPKIQEQIFTRQAATRRHPTTKHEIELCMDGVRLCLEMEYLCLQVAVHLAPSVSLDHWIIGSLDGWMAEFLDC